MQGRKRFIHLMVDSKFVDYFIEQSESVAPGESEYWVVKEDVKSDITSTQSILLPINWDKNNLKKLAEKVNSFEKLILHSFFFPYLNKFIEYLSKDILVVWMFWGADGYSFTSRIKQWYLPLTLEWKMKKRIENVSFIRGLGRQFFYKWQDYIKSRMTQKLIKRMNVCATWVEEDYEMVRHINPKMVFYYYSYFTYNQLIILKVGKSEPNYNRLWLGNSATDTNNHLDALQYLSEINWEGEIVVPLSYGSKEYGQAIAAFGKKKFGNKFIPILELLPLNEYQILMNSCGFVWMNHIRQQAAGNIITALFMGKAVILNSSNNLFKTFNEMKITLCKKEDLKNLSEIQNKTFTENSKIIEQMFSKEYVNNSLEKIYSYNQKNL